MADPSSNETQHSTDQGVWSDQQVEQKVGNLLRAGVLLSASIVGAGAVMFLAVHGHEQPHYETFQSEPQQLRQFGRIIEDAMTGNGPGLIQFGLLLLIATPVARVILAAYAFFRQRDFLYVAVSLIVLATLTISLLGITP